jgi:hypothetical protein
MTKQFRTTLTLAIAAVAVALAPSAFAVDGVASTSASVMQPLTITPVGTLAFGKFGVGIGGSVTISPSGARTSSGVVEMGGTTTAVRFDVAGEIGSSYTIALVPGTLSSPSLDTMTFSTISDLAGANITTGNVSGGALAAGTQSIFVGGTLTVGAAQPPGLYSGNLTATVQYN